MSSQLSWRQTSAKFRIVHAMNCLIFGVSLLIPFSSACSARAVEGWSLKQFESKASLICDGMVESIEETGIKKNFSYCSGAFSPPEVIMLAKIKMLGLSKGNAPTEIEFRYRAPEPPSTTVSNGVFVQVGHLIADGPQHVTLEKGKRFRFYLQPDPAHAGYINVLEGHPDDCFAVQALGSDK